MYCEKCGEEYENVFSNYDEKCECGTKLSTAWKVKEADFSCVKLIEKIG